MLLRSLYLGWKLTPRPVAAKPLSGRSVLRGEHMLIETYFQCAITSLVSLSTAVNE